MSTQTLEAAIESTRHVLAGVGPDDLGKETPCASWKVSDLVNHIVGGMHWFAATMTGEASEGEPPDHSAGDYQSAFDQGAAAAVAGFQADGAMERMVELPFGTMPGSAFLGLATIDVFTHGWDLAKATGQSTELDPELAAGLLAGARSMIPDAFRGPDPDASFGQATEAPAGASNADQLAAFLGRTV